MTAGYLPVLSYGGNKDVTPDSMERDSTAPAPADDEQSITPPHKAAAAAAVNPPQPAASSSAREPGFRPKPPSGRRKRTPKEAAKPQQEDLRRRAVFRGMEQLLESEVETEEMLLGLVKPFSGLELLQVAEERALTGVCGNAVCRHRLPASGPDKLGMLAYRGEPKSMEIIFCSTKCELEVRRLAAKLGTAETSLARFNAEGVQAAPIPSATIMAAAPELKRAQPKYAAGNTKTPIMLSEIKERDPDGDTSASVPAGGPSHSTSAVEGFVPRSRVPTPSSARFCSSGAPEEQSAAPQEVPSSDARMLAGVAERPIGADAHKVSARPRVSWAPDEQCSAPGELPGRSASTAAGVAEQLFGAEAQKGRRDGVRWQDQAHEQENSNLHHGNGKPLLGGQTGGAEEMATEASQEGGRSAGEGISRDAGQGAPQPVLVFEMEDPDSVLDGAEGELNPRFGRLSVANAQDLGLDPAELASINAPLPQPSRSLATDIEAWKRMSGAGRPSGGAQDLQAAEVLDTSAKDPASDETEGGFVESDVQQILPAADEEDDEGGEFQTDTGWLEEPEEGYTVSLSRFGRVAMALEGLVTERTLQYIQGQGYRALSTGDPIAEEVLKGLQRTVVRTLLSVVRGLSIQTPRSLLELHLDKLLRTFHAMQPIQSLQEDMWQLLITILLKGLSMDVLKSLQPFFEGQAAAARLEKYLAVLGFDVAQFEALLDIVLEEV